MSNEREKAELGARTLREFCQSWGTDIHARVLLEELFEGVMNEEALFVFGKPQQAGDQVDYGSSGGIDSHIESEGHQQPEPPPDLGT